MGPQTNFTAGFLSDNFRSPYVPTLVPEPTDLQGPRVPGDGPFGSASGPFGHRESTLGAVGVRPPMAGGESRRCSEAPVTNQVRPRRERQT